MSLDIPFYSILKSRSIIVAKGEDRKKFLQGLITNDINKINDGSIIYSFMLNAKGRFLFDFFLFQQKEEIFIDCDLARRDEILQKLNFYKLKNKVLLEKKDDMFVVASNEMIKNEISFTDPRMTKLGFRSYIYKSLDEKKYDNDIHYHYRRIKLKIPESEFDLTQEKSIIAEFGFDNLNAIDYNKGCYLGQELTARNHYLGEIRKKIYYLTINDLQKIAKNNIIFYNNEIDGKLEKSEIGMILSSVFYNDKLHCLALIRKDEQDINIENKLFIIVDNKKYDIIPF